jgi:peptide deformylase
MIRKIVNADDKVLRKRAKPVKKIDKKVKNIVKDLKETLEAQKDPEGVGLAAPQIGKSLKIFVFVSKDGIKTVINPKVIEIAEKENEKPEAMEGCLSIPHYYGPLTRPEFITIEYLNEKGKKVKETFKGFEAQIVQHEIDHLKGTLFTDRLLEQKKPLYKFTDKEKWEEVDFAL